MWHKCLNKNCGFIFSRVGECNQCPDCGKEMIREATDNEIEQAKAIMASNKLISVNNKY